LISSVNTRKRVSRILVHTNGQVKWRFVAIQPLDGVAAGIFGVISVIIAADLMWGTGRFNLAQGLIALSTGLGAGSSNLCSGFVVQWFGYTVGFITLAIIAVVDLVFFALLMPKTQPEEGSASVGPLLPKLSKN
jgi:MFS family permease